MPHRALRCVWLGNLVRQRLDEPHLGKCRSARGCPANQGGQSTPLTIPLTRQATSSCAGRGDFAPAPSTGHICQICTAAVQVSIEPVPAPNGAGAHSDTYDHHEA
jgi:hypothetical protein